VISASTLFAKKQLTASAGAALMHKEIKESSENSNSLTTILKLTDYSNMNRVPHELPLSSDSARLTDGMKTREASPAVFKCLQA
jgi:flagellar basal body P-ring protein FlgI